MAGHRHRVRAAALHRRAPPDRVLAARLARDALVARSLRLRRSATFAVFGVRQSGLIAPGDRVLVAVSGGPDSTALLIALCEEGHSVVAAHYDHALQPGSGSVAD